MLQPQTIECTLVPASSFTEWMNMNEYMIVDIFQ